MASIKTEYQQRRAERDAMRKRNPEEAAARREIAALRRDFWQGIRAMRLQP